MSANTVSANTMNTSDPVVLLENLPEDAGVAVELTEDMDGMGQQVEALEAIIQETINNDAVDEWFQPAASTSSRKTPRLSSGGKNIKAMLKGIRSPSRTPSRTPSSQSTADSDSDDGWVGFLEEEQQRRAEEEARRLEWSRRAAGKKDNVEKKLNKARELVSSLSGQEKSIRQQREVLRAQLRALDDQELSVDKRKRSALQTVKKYEFIVAKYKAMNF